MLLLNWLFPPRCVNCKKVKSWLCGECYNDFHISLEGEIQSCELRGLDRVFIANEDSSSILAKILYAWKYQLCSEPGEILQDVFADAFCRTFGTTSNIICVPIPIHKQKLRDRGFNQAGLLASALQPISALIVMALIVRCRNTKSQVGLTRLQRQENLKDAFHINSDLFRPELLSHRVVLVDDILTSGTTLQYCANVLRDVGFTNIDALVLHRGTK